MCKVSYIYTFCFPFKKKTVLLFSNVISIHLSPAYLRRLVAFSLLLDELSFWVDGKYPGFRHSNLLIGICIL